MKKEEFDTLKRIMEAVDSEKLPDSVIIDLTTFRGVKLVFEVKAFLRLPTELAIFVAAELIVIGLSDFFGGIE